VYYLHDLLKSLSGSDREFLHLLSDAAETNPFRAAYFELVPKIVAAGSESTEAAQSNGCKIGTVLESHLRRR
jgi:hypothetical protein